MICLIVTLLALALNSADGFTWMGKIKLPDNALTSIANKIDGDAKFGEKKIVVITGTSSGLGRKTTKFLLKSKRYHVICAVRDVEKMQLIAEEDELNAKDFTIMDCDLQSFASVRKFASNLKDFKAGRPIDRLVLNAAVYQPSLPEAKWTEDGIEQQMQTNHFSHFLLTSLLVSSSSTSTIHLPHLISD